MWHAFTVAADGAILVGEWRGEGVPLVLVHGFGGTRHNWDHVVAALPPDLPVVRYDLRGFGESGFDNAVPYSHDADLLALLDALGIDRAVVCGLSLGGGVVAHFALEHPDRVERLVLVDPALQGWDWSADWMEAFGACVKAAREGDLPRARQLWFESALFAPLREDPAMAAELRREIDAFAGRQWIRDAHRKVLPDVERLHRIAVPTLLLMGERDLPDFLLAADLLEATVPDIVRVDFPGAGHVLTLERPREVANAISGFLVGSF